MKKTLSFLTVALLYTSIAFSQNISNALEFNNIDDYVSIPNGTALIAGLTEFSMCGWVYPTNPNSPWPDLEGYFGIKNEGICDFYIVQLYGLGLEARITTNTGTYTLNPGDLSEVTIDEWQHFALVYTGSELQVFINGELDGSIAASGTIDYDNFEMTIGTLKFQSNNFYLDGKIDEVTIWDKALTEEEVQEHQCIGGDPSSIPNLTAYYDFNEEEGLTLPDYFGGYDGLLTNMTGNEWLVSEVCESGYSIEFTVIDEVTTQPVSGASVNLDGLTKTTDEFGVAEFTNYDPGTYNWTVNKTDYYESTGTVELIDEDISIEVELAPVLTYSITFIVTDAGNPIEDAIVNLDGILQYTDAGGTTTFTDYLPGFYSYVILKDGYEIITGTAEVIDEDLTIEIELLTNNIQQSDLQGVDIFPNPSDGLLNINFDDVYTNNMNITISDLSGRSIYLHVLTGMNNQIDLSDLQKGMYIIQLNAGDEILRTPIIIK